MTLHKYRLLIVGAHPVQYAAPVYRRLAAHPKVDLTVAFCGLQGAQPALDPDFGVPVQWDVPVLEGYRWLCVPPARLPRVLQRRCAPANPGLWPLIRRGRFDALVLYTGYTCASFWFALAAAKSARVPVLFGTDAISLQPRAGGAWKTALKAALWPRLFRLADVVIVPSSGGVALMESLGIPSERIVLTPFVVDNAWFLQRAAAGDRTATRYRWGVPAEAFVVLYCAKLVPWKRPQDPLRALARLADERTWLVYAGDGRLKPTLQRLADRLGVASRVRFLGFVNQAGLPDVYTAADVLVLPSSYEPFGVVVNEAMLCGRPAIVSDRVGARFDLVRHGETGFVYPAGHVDLLAHYLRLLRDAPGLRAELGAAARARLATWSPRENVDALVRAVERASALRSRQPCAS